MKKLLGILTLLINFSSLMSAQVPRVLQVPIPPSSCGILDLYIGQDNSFSFCVNGVVRTLNSTPGGAAFDDITSGTNTATLLIGNNGTLGVTGTGQITATKANGMTTGSVLFSGASNVISQDNTNLFWGPSSSRSGLSSVFGVEIGPNTGFTGALQGSFVGNGAGSHHTFSCLNTTDYICTSSTMEGSDTHSILGFASIAGSTNTNGTNSLVTGIEGFAYRLGIGGTTSTLAGVDAYAENDAGTTTNMASFHAFTNTKSGGSVTNNYGLLVDDQEGVGTNNYGIKTGTGKVSFGGVVDASGGSSLTVVCWKADGKTLGFATVVEITGGTCH